MKGFAFAFFEFVNPALTCPPRFRAFDFVLIFLSSFIFYLHFYFKYDYFTWLISWRSERNVRSSRVARVPELSRLSQLFTLPSNPNDISKYKFIF